MACETALVVIDMLNPYRHEDADTLVDSVGAMLSEPVGLSRRRHAPRVTWS